MSAVFHPFFSHFFIQVVIPSFTYVESVYIKISDFFLNFNNDNINIRTGGYQINNDDTGGATNGEYDNTMYSITFNVNDDLSIGYGHVESEKENSNTAEADSIQIAYTMGGASIRVAESSADDMKYQTGAAYDKDATTISVSLAF